MIIGGLAGGALLIAGSIAALIRRGPPLPDIRATASGVLALLAPANAAAAGYAALTLALAGAAAAAWGAAPGGASPLVSAALAMLRVIVTDHIK